MCRSGIIVSSMYKKYVEERTNKSVLENESGFAVYSFTIDTVYIEEIFVSDEFRKSGRAVKMADEICEIAKSKGIKKVFGSVCPSAKGSTASLKVLLAYGMRLETATNDFIIMSKEIDNG